MNAPEKADMKHRHEGLDALTRTGHTSEGLPSGAGNADPCDQQLRLQVADTFITRLLGLHGHRPLGPDEGLVLRPCAAIHTLFLRSAVDVIFLDGSLRECRRISGLVPWRMAWQRGARIVVELPAGYCDRHADYLPRIHAALAAMQAQLCQPS